LPDRPATVVVAYLNANPIRTHENVQANLASSVNNGIRDRLTGQQNRNVDLVVTHCRFATELPHKCSRFACGTRDGMKDQAGYGFDHAY
jgi:hypothetical protein